MQKKGGEPGQSAEDQSCEARGTHLGKKGGRSKI